MSPTALRLASFWDEYSAAPEAQAVQHLRGDGPVGAFEEAIRERCRMPHALAVDNATNGLLVLAIACGLHRAEIIAAPNSWGGTYGPFLLTRNTLRVAEARHDGTVDVLSITRADAQTKTRRTEHRASATCFSGAKMRTPRFYSGRLARWTTRGT